MTIIKFGTNHSWTQTESPYLIKKQCLKEMSGCGHSRQYPSLLATCGVTCVGIPTCYVQKSPVTDNTHTSVAKYVKHLPFASPAGKTKKFSCLFFLMKFTTKYKNWLLCRKYFKPLNIHLANTNIAHANSKDVIYN